MVKEEKKDVRIKMVSGRKFDADKERALAFRNKSYYACFQEFKPYQMRDFINYLMSGDVLDWEWNLRGGYNDYEYITAKGEEKIIYGNHGLTIILQDIEEGKLDPSDVLHDFAVFYRGCSFCDESTKEERQELYEKVKALIANGFSVKMVDHS